MSRPFLIRNDDTKVEFELSDPAYFVGHYQPLGFAIVNPAPTGYCVPELPKAKKAKDDEPKAETDEVKAP